MAKMESIGHAFDEAFIIDIEKQCDYALAVDTEAMMVKVFDTTTDSTALYDAMLKCDAKLQTMKRLTTKECLCAVLHKSMESVLR